MFINIDIPVERSLTTDVFGALSGHSDAASGLSDGNEGRHEGRSMKRPQSRSVRSRSRQEKMAKAKLKLNVLNVSYVQIIIWFVFNNGITLHFGV